MAHTQTGSTCIGTDHDNPGTPVRNRRAGDAERRKACPRNNQKLLRCLSSHCFLLKNLPRSRTAVLLAPDEPVRANDRRSSFVSISASSRP